MGKSWLLVLFGPFREEHVMELERWIDWSEREREFGDCESESLLVLGLLRDWERVRERRELEVAAISFQRERERDESGDFEVQGSVRERQRKSVLSEVGDGSTNTITRWTTCN